MTKKIGLISLSALFYLLWAPHAAQAIAITAASLSNTTITFETGGTPNGTTVQFTLDGPASVQVLIYDASTGQLVTSVNRDGAAGANQIFWDGLWLIGNDLGRKDRNYLFQIAASTGSTSTSFLISSVLQITSVDIHNVAVTTSFDAGNEPAFPYGISYDLAKDARVTLTVQNSSGTVVRTLLSNQLQVSENVSSHTITWNGLADDGHPVDIGLYTITLDASDPSNGDHAITRTRSVAVTSLAGVSDPDKLFDDNVYVFPNPIRNGQGTFRFQTVRDNANVTIKIYTLTGDLVRSEIFSNLAVGNIIDFVWDATNQAGRKVGRGLYYYVVREEDAQGTLQTIKKVAVIQ